MFCNHALSRTHKSTHTVRALRRFRAAGNAIISVHRFSGHTATRHRLRLNSESWFSGASRSTSEEDPSVKLRFSVHPKEVCPDVLTLEFKHNTSHADCKMLLLSAAGCYTLPLPRAWERTGRSLLFGVKRRCWHGAVSDRTYKVAYQPPPVARTHRLTWCPYSRRTGGRRPRYYRCLPIGRCVEHSSAAVARMT